MISKTEPTSPARPLAEPLEPRTLFAIVVAGTPVADDIRIALDADVSTIDITVNGTTTQATVADATAQGGIVVNAGDGADSVHFDGIGAVPATLNGEAGDDRIFVGDGSIADGDLGADVSVVGGAGNDSVTFDDSSAADAASFTVSNPFNTYLTIARAGSATVFVDLGTSATAAEQITLAAGPNADRVNVTGSDALTTLNVLAGDGADSITLGNDIDSKFPGVVIVDGGANAGANGGDLLTVDDSADSFGDIYTFGASGSQGTIGKNSGGATLRYSAVEHVSLLAGLAGTTPNNQQFRVNGLPLGAATTISAGSGDDHLTVGDGMTLGLGASVLAPVTFIGGADVDQIDYLDTLGANPSSYTVNPAALQVDGVDVVGYDGVEKLNVVANAGNNAMRVAQTINFMDVTLNGGAGDDWFYVGSGDVDSTVADSVSIIGGSGGDGMYIDDSADDAGNDTYVFSSGQLVRAQRSVLWSTSSADAVEYIALFGSPNDDLVTVNGGSAYTHLRIEGRGGNDTFNVARTSDTNGTSTNLPVTVVSGDGNDTLNVNSDFAGTDATVELTEATEDVASLDVRVGGRLIVSSRAVQNLDRVLVVRSQLTVSGLLDLNDQTLDVRPGAMSFANLNVLVTAGANKGWLPTAGTPMIASTIAAGSVTVDALALVTADAVGLPLYAGVQTLSGDTIVRYTLAGDANLDRVVDFRDLLVLAKSYATTGRLWTDGNFDYDAAGSVDFTDLLQLAKNYGTTVNAVAAAPAAAQVRRSAK